MNEMINVLQVILNAAMLLILSKSAYEDIKSRELKASTVYITAGLTALQLILKATSCQWLSLISCIITGLFMLLVYFICIIVGGTNGVGGGDIKIMVLISAFLGWESTIVLVIAHALAAAIYWLYERIINKKKIKSVPLMVYIFIGYVITKYIFEVI